MHDQVFVTFIGSLILGTFEDVPKHTCTHPHAHIHTHTFMHTERERERDIKTRKSFHRRCCDSAPTICEASFFYADYVCRGTCTHVYIPKNVQVHTCRYDLADAAASAYLQFALRRVHADHVHDRMHIHVYTHANV